MFRLQPVRILLESGQRDAGRAGGEHAGIGVDQLRRAIAHDNLFRMYVGIACRQLGVDPHAGRVFRQQRVEIGLDFLFQPFVREIGIHQIAEIQQHRETPVASEAATVERERLIAFREERLGVVQVLLVVDLVPFLRTDYQGFQVRLVQERDDLQYLLIVFVIAQGLAVSHKERDIFVAREVLAELVDINRLVIGILTVELECLLGDEIGNAVLLVERDDGAVHPALILGNHRQVGGRVVYQSWQDTVGEDQVRLEQDRLILHEELFRQVERVDVVCLVVDRVRDVDDGRVMDLVAQQISHFLAFVANHDDDSFQGKAFQLSDHAFDQGLFVHFDHALRVLAGQLAKALTHSCR